MLAVNCVSSFVALRSLIHRKHLNKIIQNGPVLISIHKQKDQEKMQFQNEKIRQANSLIHIDILYKPCIIKL